MKYERDSGTGRNPESREDIEQMSYQKKFYTVM